MDPNLSLMLQLIEEQDSMEGKPHGKVTASPTKANIFRGSVEGDNKAFHMRIVI